jgi:hypothetical protein
VRLAFPIYTRTRKDPRAAQRAIRRPEVNLWFACPGGEGRTFNLFLALSRIRCPTLVLGGEEDPMISIECQEDIAAALPAHLVRFERFPNCRHSVIADAPLSALYATSSLFRRSRVQAMSRDRTTEQPLWAKEGPVFKPTSACCLRPLLFTNHRVTQLHADREEWDYRARCPLAGGASTLQATS